MDGVRFEKKATEREQKHMQRNIERLKERKKGIEKEETVKEMREN